MKLCPICHRCYEDTEVVCHNDKTALVASRPGTRLIADKYRLDRLLGRGGMGAVYAGTHVDLDRAIAVKLLLPDFTADSDALERFRREARATARLNHPNVADTYDYGVLADGGAYIVMELVEGQTLREYMDAAGQMSFGEVAEIGRQMAAGIEAAHHRNIVHRDLKPSNIIMARDHQDELQVKVVDFGVAQLKEYSTTGGGLTASGSLIGTPRYMSPEQCSGHKTDARSDIYSLGVILFEMLAGRAPFDAPTATAIAIKHIQQQPPSLTEFRPDASPELDRFLQQVLDKDPSQRPQTAGEFAKKLGEVLSAFNAPKISLPAAGQTIASTLPSTPLPGRETNAFDAQDKATGRTGEPTADHSFVRDEPSIRGYAEPSEVVTELVTKISEPPEISETPMREAKPVEETRASSSDDKALDETREVKHYQTKENRAGARRPVMIFGGAAFVLGFIGVALWLMLGRSAEKPAANNSTDNAAQQATQTTRPAENPAPAGDVGQRSNGAQPKETPRGVGDVRSELRAALDDWVATTNARDLNGQMSHYAPTLNVFYLKRGVPQSMVRAEKARLLSQVDSVSIQIGEPDIQLDADGQSATMRFRKSWSFRGALVQSGEVIQELRWRKFASGWKIISERDVEVIRVGR